MDVPTEAIPFIDAGHGMSPQTNSEIRDSRILLSDLHDSSDTPVVMRSAEKYVGDVLDMTIKGPHKVFSTQPSYENVSHSRENSFKFPLHSAAKGGKVKVLERLLVKGDPLTTDFKKRTPLHYACGFAYQKKALRMIDAILKSPQAQNTPEDESRKKRLIDFQDKDGETGLHIAAKTGHPLVVEKLLFSAADVNIKDKNKVEPLELIYHKVPQSMIPVFDGAVECKIGDPNDQNLIVRFDFGSIVGYPEPDNLDAKFEMETKLLSYSLQQSEKKRTAILLHPIVQVFLHLKWKKIRILLWISILYHVIWLLLYTIFITDLYLTHCPYKLTNENEETDVRRENDDGRRENQSEYKQRVEYDYDSEDNATFVIPTDEACAGLSLDLLSSLNYELVFLFIVTISVAVKELYEIFQTPQLKLYFVQLENVGQWVLIGVVGLTALPLLSNQVIIHSWQYQAAALGIFLAWSLILSQIGKIPRFGIYIEMLGKVLKSFAMFMITFASLLVAFTVSFQILMPEKAEFRSFPWGFLKVMVMMVGEVNYDEVFHDEDSDSQIPFPASTKLLYSAFVSIVTIILFNLLIGLTVSDTQGLQDGAQLTSLSSQLDQIYLMEKFVFSMKIQNWLRTMNKADWLRYFLVTQQDDNAETNMGLDIHISKIPRNLQHQIREIAIPNVRQEDDEDEEDEDDDEIRSKEEAPAPVEPVKDVIDSISQKGYVTATSGNDLKQQIRDVLRELLEELRNENIVHKRITSDS